MRHDAQKSLFLHANMRAKNPLSWLPTNFKSWGKIFLASMLILFILRVVFYGFYFNQFVQSTLSEWLAGIYFDFITVCSLLFPFTVVHFLPINIRHTKGYRIWAGFNFIGVNLILIVVNFIDLEYFKYTSRRSTFELFKFFNTGSDFRQLAGTFLAEFWWMMVLMTVFVLLLIWYFRRYIQFQKVVRPWFFKELVAFCIVTPLIIVGTRGGVQLKPLDIIDATKFAQPKHSALVLNTAFTMMKTVNKKGLEEKQWFSQEESLSYFNPIQQSKPAGLLPDQQNVVFIILESFGSEWVRAVNPKMEPSYTPFLDSLAKESMLFTNAYANGKKSIEAVPSILASIPSLMNNPYLSSFYGENQINTLPRILKAKGYTSAFYHGATNGSMQFDAFAALAGIEQYIGRTEYNNDAHFDGKWGILDEYFNPWSAKQMSKLEQPFLSTLFTLSSHHPYFIPEHRKDDIVKGPSKIGQSISYGDLSLRLFFEEAKKQPWYNNTLFVLLADHSPASTDVHWSLRHSMYKIPVLFYHPGGHLPKGEQTEIIQQLDLFPSILDLLNIESKYYAFGQSYFQEKAHEAITYLEGTYYYFSGDWMLEFNGESIRSITNVNDFSLLKPAQKEKLKSDWGPRLKRLKAYIQRYNHDLIMNETTAK